jgi:hypothetical protein
VDFCVVHDCRKAFGYCREQAIYKPAFKKITAGWLLVTFNAVMSAITQGANGIYPFKMPPRFDAFNLFPPRGTAVFPL